MLRYNTGWFISVEEENYVFTHMDGDNEAHPTTRVPVAVVDQLLALGMNGKSIERISWFNEKTDRGMKEHRFATLEELEGFSLEGWEMWIEKDEDVEDYWWTNIQLPKTVKKYDDARKRYRSEYTVVTFNDIEHGDDFMGDMPVLLVKHDNEKYAELLAEKDRQLNGPPSEEEILIQSLFEGI